MFKPVLEINVNISSCFVLDARQKPDNGLDLKLLIFYSLSNALNNNNKSDAEASLFLFFLPKSIIHLQNLLELDIEVKNV